MDYYGLHWSADDNSPLQVRIRTATQEVWARACPSGGDWTNWRRLDVNRNADNTINEVCAVAISARQADAALRLARPVSITLTGDVTGSCVFDGASNVVIETSADAISLRVGNLEQRQDQLEDKAGKLSDASQSQNVRLAFCENQIEDHTREISSISGNIDSLTATVNKFAGQDSNMAARVAKLEAGFIGSEPGSQIAEIKAALGSGGDLESRVARLEEWVYRGTSSN